MSSPLYTPQNTTFKHSPALAQLPIPKLEFLFHLECDLYENYTDIGAGPFGHRKHVLFKGGQFEGPLMRGTVQQGGGDWLLVSDDLTAHLDTRYNLITHDGATIYIQTKGVRKGPREVLARMATEEVDPTEYSMRLTVVMETGAPRYSWLNKAVVIASCAKSGSQVIYDAYQLL